MVKSAAILFFISVVFFLSKNESLSQQEITVLTLDNPAPGYLFMQSFYLDYIGFVDNSGKVAYKKKLKNSESAITMELQPNNRISYFSNNKFYLADINYNVLDSFQCKNGLETDFHDIKITPDGHAFLIGIKTDTVDMSVIVPGGKPNAVLQSSVIQEQDQNKNVVWEWHSSDYYNIIDVTSDIDLTWENITWVHANWIEFDSDGNLLLSTRNLDEITKINRQSGDIIWRLGGKDCKNNQFTFLNDTVNGFYGFSHQHSIHKLSNGNLLMFDNGNQKPMQFSRAVEYELNETNKTIRKVWEYHSFPEASSVFQGSVQRLPNGNTMIGWGTNNQQMTMTEVRPDGSVAADFRNFEAYLSMRFPVRMASRLIKIENAGTYTFSDSTNKTGLTVKINSMTGSGYVSAERHYYSPYNISYSGSAPLKTYSNRWVINNKGITNFSAKISFKLYEIDSLDSPEKNKIYWRAHEGNGSFAELETVYNQSSGSLEADINSFGEFILGEPQIYTPPVHVAPVNNSKKQPMSVDLLWMKVTNADSYKIQISTDAEFKSLTKDTMIANDTIYTFIPKNNNTDYYWRLKSVFGTNQSDWNNPWKFTTILETPQIISPEKGDTNFSVNGLFKWNAVNGALYYKLNVKTKNEVDSIIIDESAVTDTIYETSVLEYNKDYYWQIKAMNSDNESNWSDTIYFRTAVIDLLNSPELLAPAKDTIDVPVSGLIEWKSVTEAKQYNIEISLYPDFLMNTIDIDNIDSTNYFYSNLNYETIYYWRVSATDGVIISPWSEIWNFKTASFNSVTGSNKQIQIEIESGLNNTLIFRILPDNSDIVSLMVYDYMGRVVLKNYNLIMNSGAINLNTENLPDGIYFYNIIIGNKNYYGKFTFFK